MRFTAFKCLFILIQQKSHKAPRQRESVGFSFVENESFINILQSSITQCNIQLQQQQNTRRDKRSAFQFAVFFIT